MTEGIRIDQLPQTASPTEEHVFPAMRGGQTVKLLVSQLRQLLGMNDLSSTVQALEGNVDSQVREVVGISTGVRDYVVDRRLSGCFVTRDTPQVIPSGVITQAEFDAVLWDYDNWWDISGPATFYTPDSADVPRFSNLLGVRLSAGFQYDAPAGTLGEVRWSLSRSGGAWSPAGLPGMTPVVLANHRFFSITTGIVPALPDDLFRLEVYQNSGADRTITSLWANIEAFFKPQ